MKAVDNPVPLLPPDHVAPYLQTTRDVSSRFVEGAYTAFSISSNYSAVRRHAHWSPDQISFAPLCFTDRQL